MRDKLIPVLVVVVVTAAFLVGMLYGKVRVYEKTLGEGKVTGVEQPGDQAQAPQAPSQTVILSKDQWEEVIVNAAAKKGEADAKVKLVEFSDYQCPFCARYISETYEKILKEYVDTGKVQYLFRDLPLQFHQNAKPAALAARCAGDQGKYWEMHDEIFKNQPEWSSEEGEVQEMLEGYASDLGINMSKFSGCYQDKQFVDEIDADLALAQKVGASGTPTFFINGEKIVGALPYEAFQAAIDKALAE